MKGKGGQTHHGLDTWEMFISSTLSTIESAAAAESLGCSAACLIAAAMLAAGASFRLPILLGLVAIAIMALMLNRWYGRERRA